MPNTTFSLAHLLFIGHTPELITSCGGAIDGDTVTVDPWCDCWVEQRQRVLEAFKSQISPGTPAVVKQAAPQPRGTARARAAKVDLSCVHRGEQTREVLCPTCSGHVTAKVFGCALFTECTLFNKPLPGVKSCRGCAEREPPSDKSSSPAVE